jgi:hypothetical protein
MREGLRLLPASWNFLALSSPLLSLCPSLPPTYLGQAHTMPMLGGRRRPSKLWRAPGQGLFTRMDQS